MATLIPQPDGSVLWDYDVPAKQPTKKTAAPKATNTNKES